MIEFIIGLAYFVVNIAIVFLCLTILLFFILMLADGNRGNIHGGRQPVKRPDFPPPTSPPPKGKS